MKKIPDWVIRYGIPAAVVILGGLIGFAGYKAARAVELRPARGESLPAEDPGEGIGRNPAVVRYLGPAHAGDAETAYWLDTYTEWEGPVPEWYRPWESMAAEWFASCQQVAEFSSDNGFASFDKFSASFQQVKDAGCPDYSIEAEVFPDWILDVPLDRWLQEYIHGLCEESGLPYTLAVAVIEAESSYIPWTVSDSDDYGLMQINAVCHDWLDETLGITDFLNPYQSARAGIYILSGYYEQYGYPSGALMAYNMGEAAAESLFEQGIYSTAYSDRVLAIKARLDSEGR